MNGSIGNWLICIGVFFLVAGLIAKSGLLAWFGHLPGDVHVERENFQFYFPLGSMVVISVVLSLCIAIYRKL